MKSIVSPDDTFTCLEGHYVQFSELTPVSKRKAVSAIYADANLRAEERAQQITEHYRKRQDQLVEAALRRRLGRINEFSLPLHPDFPRILPSYKTAPLMVPSNMRPTDLFGWKYDSISSRMDAAFIEYKDTTKPRLTPRESALRSAVEHNRINYVVITKDDGNKLHVNKY